MKSMKMMFIIFLSLITLSSYAQEPVVITHADVPSLIGLTYEKLVYKGGEEGTQTVDISNFGDNQIWDLTTFDLPITEDWEVVSKDSTQFAADFPQSNLVYKVLASNNDIVTYNFLRLTETDLSELGQAQQIGSTTARLVKSHAIDAKADFPVTATDEPWVSVPIYETTYEFLPGIMFEVLVHDSNYYEIDGWGIARTPLGDIECLRVRQYHQMDIYFKGSDTPIYPEYEKYIVYSWVAPIYGFIATVKSSKGETDFNFTQAAEITVMSKFRPTHVPLASNEPDKDLSFILFDNYPNPFNPTTTIAYKLGQPSPVKLTIFNLQGQEITTLVDEYKTAGFHSVVWSGDSYPSGLYLYQIEAAGAIIQKRCTLLK